MRGTLEERFWAKVAKVDGGCWLWTASVDIRGYGKIGFGPKHAGWARAHRLSWEWANGPIPDGLFVCHRCDVRACVNPAHLFLGTAKDNTQDMVRKGRLNPWNGGKTHCKRGHEFTPENTVRKRGGRACRECKRAYELRLYYRARASSACSYRS